MEMQHETGMKEHFSPISLANIKVRRLPSGGKDADKGYSDTLLCVAELGTWEDVVSCLLPLKMVALGCVCVCAHAGIYALQLCLEWLGSSFCHQRIGQIDCIIW